MNAMLHSIARRARRIPAALALLLALPFVAWAAHSLIAVSSVTVPAAVTTGSSATGSVTLDAVATKLTSVALSSSNSGLASVPASVTVGSKTRSKSFTITTTNGQLGCATISAQLGSTAPRSAVIAVAPRASTDTVRLTIPAGPFVSGQTVTGTVRIVPAPATTTRVLLASSNTAHATVPAFIDVPVTLNESFALAAADFPIRTSASGITLCPIITATKGSSSAKVLVKLSPIGG